MTPPFLRPADLIAFSMRGKVIPEYMYEGILRYVNEGNLPGSFLRAIISNNLRSAVYCADDINIDLIPTYVGFFWNHVPALCWGSEEIMYEWSHHNGLSGVRK